MAMIRSPSINMIGKSPSIHSNTPINPYEMVDIVGPTQAKSATANGAVLDKDLNRIWYERLRSNVNYGKPQDRQYGGKGETVHIYMSPPISFTEVACDFFGLNIVHPIESGQPNVVQALHKSGRRERQSDFDQMEFDPVTHRPRKAVISGHSWDAFKVTNEVETSGTPKFDEKFLKDTLLYEKHMDGAMWEKLKKGHDVPASPSPKQISDLLQKIHAVYDAVITDEVTMVRSVKAYLYSEASHEEMITRSILCVLFPIWLGMTVYSTVCNEAAPSHQLSKCCPAHKQDEKCHGWLHGEGKERYLSEKLRVAYQSLADKKYQESDRRQGSMTSKIDVLDWIKHAAVFHENGEKEIFHEIDR